MAYTLVLLAGDAGYQQFLLENRNKSLLRLGDRLLLDFSLRAISRTRIFSKLIVVGPKEVLQHVPEAVDHIEVVQLAQRDSVAQNIHQALIIAERFSPSEPVVFVTNDTPFLQPTELESVLNAALTRGVAATIAVSRIDDSCLAKRFEAFYRRSTVPLRDGAYLIGNVFALRSSAISVLAEIDPLFSLRKQSRPKTWLRTMAYILRSRKSVFAVARWIQLVVIKLLGTFIPSTILRFLSPTLRNVERSVGYACDERLSVALEEIGASGACWDIDTERQLSAVRRELAAPSLTATFGEEAARAESC